jgi:maltooligosyltrehalose trehalohydrolase
MLFMGEEYGETADFVYFTDHGDPALIEAVREGRRKEIAEFFTGRVGVDPQDAAAFQNAKLNWELRGQAPHSGLLAWYRDWIAMRKQHACLNNCRKSMVRAQCDAASQWLAAERRDLSGSRALLVCNCSEAGQEIPIPFKNIAWSRYLWSSAERYGPPAPDPAPEIREYHRHHVELAGHSAAVYMASVEGIG